MCSGGVGSANNADNDSEEGSGNSFKETLANIFTPGDGMSYVDGRLTENNKNRDQKFYDHSSSNNNNDDGPGYTTIMVDGEKKQIRRDANDKYKQRYASALFGAATGGLPGLLGSVATNELTKGSAGQSILNVGDTAGGAVGGIKKMFATPTFDTPEEKAAYEAKQKEQMLQHNRMMALMSGDGESAPVQAQAGAPASQPTVTLDGQLPPSAMSTSAAIGGFEPIPNPDYNPNDPSSQKFIINPTYAQLLAHQQSKQSMGMAEGGALATTPIPMRGGGYMGDIYPYGMAQPQPAFNNFNFNGGGGNYGGMLMSAGGQPAYSEPLQQYGSYLEGQYGDPGFDQKKDNFLQEVNSKEQQTFGGFGGLGIMSTLQGYQGPSNQGPPSFLSDQQLPFPQNLLRQGANQGFAEGGEIEVAPPEGGNEKTMISDAVRAVKGELPEEQSKAALGQFLANYGEEALRDLVDKVQSGEMGDTVERFANGEAGEVNGPGDGSGVDDKVPASLEGQQDVLLADGEFVLRKKTADALEKKYGGGFLDAVNKSESAAPKTMQQYMARN